MWRALKYANAHAGSKMPRNKVENVAVVKAESPPHLVLWL